MQALTLAIAALAVSAMVAVVALSRRNLVHPAAAFGLPFFFFVAAAQLHLTHFMHDWSASFAAMVLGGGALFCAGAFFACGTRAPRLNLARADYPRPNRLLIAVVLLAIGAAIGWAYKSTIPGGVPVFSGHIDAERLRAHDAGGFPAWSTFLTDGARLGSWLLLAYAYLRWRESSRALRAAMIVGALLLALGSGLGASRNELVLTFAVPLIAIYAVRRTRGLRLTWRPVVAGLLGLVLISGVYIYRVEQGPPDSYAYLNTGSGAPATLKRAVLPLFIAGAYPLEDERRLTEAMPSNYSFLRGAASLSSLPDFTLPGGKPLGDILGALSVEESEGIHWTVGSYQAQAFADGGTLGVLLISLLLGLGLGCAYRSVRDRSGLFAIATTAYIAYVAAFMVYSNLLSFSLNPFYELAVIAGVDAWARRGRLGKLSPVDLAQPAAL
jgi:oligosaccharide repeat unit polymerase